MIYYPLFLLTLSLAFAQSFSNLNQLSGVSFFTRIYSSKNEPLGDLAFPLAQNSIQSKKSLFQDKNAQYIRTIGIFSDQLKNGQPTSLSEISDHKEKRRDDSVKLVFWTPIEIWKPETEIFMEAIQNFLFRVFVMKRGQDLPTDGMTLALNRLFIPNTTTEIEIELFHADQNQLTKTPACRRNDFENSTQPVYKQMLPCPTFILLPELLMQTFIKSDLVTSLDRFLSTIGPNQVNDIFLPNLMADFQSDNQNWFFMPLILETRVLAVKKKIMNDLGLKMPPPYSNWGTNQQDWNWQAFMGQLAKLQQATESPFHFQADRNEENLLISLLLQSNDLAILDDKQTCQLQSDSVQGVLNQTVGLIWNSKRSLVNQDYLPNNDEFNTWQSKSLQSPLDHRFQFCCQNSQPIGPAYSFLRPRDIGQGLTSDKKPTQDPNQAEYLPALMPGLSIFGGLGLGIMKNALNPSLGWALLSYMSSVNNSYLNRLGQLAQTTPPYLSLQSKQPWTGQQYSLVKTQLNQARPFRGESLSFNTGEFYLQEQPMRYMLMEVMFKNLGMKEASQRACQLINSFSLPFCSQQKVQLQSRQCDALHKDKLDIAQDGFILSDCRVDYSQLSDSLNQIECPFLPYELPIALASLGVNGFGMILTLFFFVFLLAKPKGYGVNGLIIIFSVGVLAMFGSSALYLGLPTKFLCIARVWFLSFGFCLLFGCLLSMLIPSFKASVLPIILGVNLIVLFIWTFIGNVGVDQQKTGLEDLNQNQVTIQAPECSLGKMPALLTIVGVDLLLLLVTFVLSWRSLSQNDLPERRQLTGITTLALLIVTAIILAITLVHGLQTKLIILVFGIFLLGMVSIMIYFPSKLTRKPEKVVEKKVPREESLHLPPVKMIPTPSVYKSETIDSVNQSSSEASKAKDIDSNIQKISMVSSITEKRPMTFMSNFTSEVSSKRSSKLSNMSYTQYMKKNEKVSPDTSRVFSVVSLPKESPPSVKDRKSTASTINPKKLSILSPGVPLAPLPLAPKEISKEPSSQSTASLQNLESDIQSSLKLVEMKEESPYRRFRSTYHSQNSHLSGMTDLRTEAAQSTYTNDESKGTVINIDDEITVVESEEEEVDLRDVMEDKLNRNSKEFSYEDWYRGII